MVTITSSSPQITLSSSGGLDAQIIAPLDNGQYVVLWQESEFIPDPFGFETSILGRIVDAAGAPVGSDFTLIPSTQFTNDIRLGDVVALGDDRFAFSFEEFLGDFTNVLTAVADSSGELLSPVTFVSPNVSNGSRAAGTIEMATLDGFGYAIVGSDSDVVFVRSIAHNFDEEAGASSLALGELQFVGTENPADSTLAPTIGQVDDAHFAVAWSVGDADGLEDFLNVQLFDFAGAPASDIVRVRADDSSSVIGASDSFAPSIVDLNEDTFLLAYSVSGGAEPGYLVLDDETLATVGDPIAAPMAFDLSRPDAVPAGDAAVAIAYTAQDDAGFERVVWFVDTTDGEPFGDPAIVPDAFEGRFLEVFAATPDADLIAVGRAGTNLDLLVTQFFEVDLQGGPVALTNGSIDENSPGGSLLGEILFTGIDEEDVAGLAISGPAAEVFELTEDRRLLVVEDIDELEEVELNHEAADQLELTVTVTTTDGEEIDTVFAISVDDVNEAPTEILPEDQPVLNLGAFDNGDVLTVLLTEDEDEEDEHEYEIVSLGPLPFRLEDDRLIVTNAALLNEIVGTETFSFDVTSTDLEGLELTQTVDLEVASVVPDPFVVRGVEFVENAAGGFLQASGDFTIGRSDGVDALLDIDGGVIRAFDDRIELVSGSVFSAIGPSDVALLNAPLFSGGFTLPSVNPASAVRTTVGGPLNVGVAEFDITEFELRPDQLVFNGEAAFDNEVATGSALLTGEDGLTISQSEATFGMNLNFPGPSTLSRFLGLSVEEPFDYTLLADLQTLSAEFATTLTPITVL